MKKIGFIFSHAPHGTSLGREGLDAILGVSAIITQIYVFFIGDGVLQLIKSHNPENILSRNYIPVFSILSLYDIKNFFCCKPSLYKRGLSYDTNFLLNVKILETDILRIYLEKCDAIINF